MPVDRTSYNRTVHVSNLLTNGSEAMAVNNGDPIRDALEQLSEHELKTFYSRCSQESVERRLGGGEAMTCSISYDVLLNRHFAGDFKNLVAWSRAPGKSAPE